VTSLGPVSLDSEPPASYGVYGRAGWISRYHRDEVAAGRGLADVAAGQGCSDPAAVAFNPFDANIATGTDKTNLVKIGGSGRICGATASRPISTAARAVLRDPAGSGIVATVTGEGTQGGATERSGK
jgi:hypothetical protein